MAYRLEADESIEVGIRRIATEQVEKAIGELNDRELGPQETVHQVRKRCKKVRGLLRLARPGLGKIYATQNRAFRDAARSLSAVRDAEASLETYDDLIGVYGELIDQRRFRTIRTTFEHRKDAIEDEFSLDERLDAFRAFCETQLEEIQIWELQGDGLASVAAGLGKTYGRGHREFSEALEAGTAEAYHEWRKRVKYHWYHMRILRDVWPAVVQARRDELDQLSDLLGDEHDLAVMQQEIAADPHSFAGFRTIQALFGIIERRRLELQTRAAALGECVYAEDADDFTDRFETYLAVWKRRPGEFWAAT